MVAPVMDAVVATPKRGVALDAQPAKVKHKISQT